MSAWALYCVRVESQLSLTGSLLLARHLGLSDAMAHDIDLVHIASPFPRCLLGCLAVFLPPGLDPFRDDFLGVGHYNVLEMG